MIQLVVSGNRIVAHGEDCFLSMCGTVVCTATGRVFQNATVVNHDGAIPSDIDSVGYEYHAGDFVPCAPYGKGTGNIAVVCDDCKTIKDSGVSSKNLPNLVDSGVILSYIPSVSINAHKIIYETGMFVALGYSSIKHSTDLETWSTVDLPLSYAYDIAYGDGKFVVVGSDGIAYGTDSSWTAAELPESYEGLRFCGVAYGNGRFVATMEDSNNRILCSYSEDGKTWTEPVRTGVLDDGPIAFGNGKFVVANKGEYAYSTDGTNWTPEDDYDSINGTITSIKYLNDSFYAVSKNGKVSRTKNPEEGWEVYTSCSSNYDWFDIDYKDGVLVVLGDGVVESNIGNLTELSETGMRAVANNGEQFVAVGSYMLTSNDGKEWPIRGQYRLRTPDMVDITDTVKEILG